MKSKTTTLLFAITILALAITPIISAANGWSSFNYYNTPLDYLENPWIMFGIIFIILFGIIFYVLNKSFKNGAIAATIALGLSLFISMAVAQRGLLQDYGYGELSSWALIIGSMIALAFLIRFSNESFGRYGVMSSIFIIWLVIYNLDPYQVLPNSLFNSGFFKLYDFLFGVTSPTTGIITIIILLLAGFIFGSGGPRPVINSSIDFYQEMKRRIK